MITGALALGIVLGVVAAPALRSSVASAQTQNQGNKTGLRGFFLDRLAAALGIQRPALDAAIKTAGAQTADQAVKEGRLTQPQADKLKQRIDQGQAWGFGWGGHERGGFAAFGQVRQAMVDAAAKELKITSDQLVADLRGGKTVARLATEHNTTEQAVVNAALGAAKARLDQAVKDGKLSQAQADQLYARLRQAGSRLLQGANHGERHGGKRNGSAPAQTPAPLQQQ